METKSLSFGQMEDLEGGSITFKCALASAAYGAAIGGGIASVIATGGAALPAIIALSTTVSAGLAWGSECFKNRHMINTSTDIGDFIIGG